MKREPTQDREAAIDLIHLLLTWRETRQANQDYTLSHEYQLKQLLSKVLFWRYSESEGHKYLACRYWSLKAMEVRRMKGVVTSRRDHEDDALRHEHVFPRDDLIKELFQLQEPTRQQVAELMERLCVAAIVTSDEDRILGKRAANRDDIWQRYSGIAGNWPTSSSDQKTASI